MSWTKLSRVSRAFTVSDVSLLCMLPRLVLNEVHHVTLLVYLVFALSREQTRGRLVLLDKNSPIVNNVCIAFCFDDISCWESIRSTISTWRNCGIDEIERSISFIGMQHCHRVNIVLPFGRIFFYDYVLRHAVPLFVTLFVDGSSTQWDFSLCISFRIFFEI